VENARVLIVEKDVVARKNLTAAVTHGGYKVTATGNSRQAVDALATGEYDVVITDMSVPDISGIQLLEHVKAVMPDVEVIITGSASIEAAVEAMRKGAYYYLAKPLLLAEVPIIVEKALEKRRLKLEVANLEQDPQQIDAPPMIGYSSLMRKLRQDIAQVAPADCMVLIQGATGTGKELVARLIHASSPRGTHRFLAVNCAAFTENLLANELFGHEKGAFTGAEKAQKGLIEATDKGTFLLDEVGDMSLTMQTNLLRVLETQTLLRVGGTTEIPVDVRIIAATNHNLKMMVEAGSFRSDLYYRLNVITLQIPSLAERREDIPLLANYFVNWFAARLGKDIPEIDDSVIKAFAHYAFPGNVRELKHMMERAVVLCNGKKILLAHLPPEIGASQQLRSSEKCQSLSYDTIVSLDENEKRYLAWVLEQVNGSRGRAAKLLGLNRGSLWRKLKHFSLGED
jgi:DNA-binding NtrC family response regulator